MSKVKLDTEVTPFMVFSILIHAFLFVIVLWVLFSVKTINSINEVKDIKFPKYKYVTYGGDTKYISKSVWYRLQSKDCKVVEIKATRTILKFVEEFDYLDCENFILN